MKQVDVLLFNPLARMKLETENLGFCIKLVILFVQANFNAIAGYMPVHTVFLLAYTLNKLHFYI